jgi:hypothetical protein
MIDDEEEEETYDGDMDDMDDTLVLTGSVTVGKTAPFKNFEVKSTYNDFDSEVLKTLEDKFGCKWTVVYEDNWCGDYREYEREISDLLARYYEHDISFDNFDGKSTLYDTSVETAEAMIYREDEDSTKIRLEFILVRNEDFCQMLEEPSF